MARILFNFKELDRPVLIRPRKSPGGKDPGPSRAGFVGPSVQKRPARACRSPGGVPKAVHAFEAEFGWIGERPRSRGRGGASLGWKWRGSEPEARLAGPPERQGPLAGHPLEPTGRDLLSLPFREGRPQPPSRFAPPPGPPPRIQPSLETATIIGDRRALCQTRRRCPARDVRPRHFRLRRRCRERPVRSRTGRRRVSSSNASAGVRTFGIFAAVPPVGKHAHVAPSIPLLGPAGKTLGPAAGRLGDCQTGQPARLLKSRTNGAGRGERRNRGVAIVPCT